MKKKNYTPPQITLVDLTEKVLTELEVNTSANAEGSVVMMSWLLGGN